MFKKLLSLLTNLFGESNSSHATTVVINESLPIKVETPKDYLMGGDAITQRFIVDKIGMGTFCIVVKADTKESAIATIGQYFINLGKTPHFDYVFYFVGKENIQENIKQAKLPEWYCYAFLKRLTWHSVGLGTNEHLSY